MYRSVCASYDVVPWSGVSVCSCFALLFRLRREPAVHGSVHKVKGLPCICIDRKCFQLALPLCV